MPSGPPELHAKWQSDERAIDYLQSRGYTLQRDWTWKKPSPTYEVTDEEAEAINYLVLEWDFGGVADKR